MSALTNDAHFSAASTRRRQLVTREAVRVAVAKATTYETYHAGGSRSRRASVDTAVEAPSPELAQLLETLRSSVAGYVCERRDTGLPIERVLPEVKALVREAAVCERWRDPADTLMAQAVRWSIEAYYDRPLVVQERSAD